ncbi:MAG: glycosyltransferase [Planctomycetes bacterium]|nr:glycosyltransferase [Planctomycetota bacterium]
MTGCRILYHHRIRADDGQAVHVRELIGALREEGHDVLECALVQKAGVAASPGADAHARRNGSLWNRLRLPRGAIELLEIAYGPQGARRLRLAAADFRPDFVYERHALHCDAGLRAARSLGVPLLLEVNSPLVDEMQALGALRFPRRARRTEHAVLAGADIVFAVTGVLRDLCVGLGARAARTVVVPNGAVPERYDDAARAAGRALRSRLSIAADDFVLGFVGFMRPWHRLDLAVEMLLRPELRALHLVLVGEGPARADVAAAAVRAGVSSRVHAIGAVDAGELPGCVCAFDAALIPAINRYASPLKLFDSLAAGVPTICPRQANLEELVIDDRNAVLFAPGDADALRAATARLVLDRAAARRIGAQGRADLLTNDWTWRGNARRVIAAYRRLVADMAVPR